MIDHPDPPLWEYFPLKIIKRPAPPPGPRLATKAQIVGKIKDIWIVERQSPWGGSTYDGLELCEDRLKVVYIILANMVPLAHAIPLTFITLDNLKAVLGDGATT